MAKTSAALSVFPGGAGFPAAPADDLIDAVQNYIEAKIAPLRERILLQQAEIEVLKAKPRDGLGLAGGFIDQAGMLLLTASDGTLRECGIVIGRDGEPGKDGRDGFGFDDLEVAHDGERKVTFKFVRGGHVKEFSVLFPVMIYRGIYNAVTAYATADCVSFGGSIWYCLEPTIEKPGNGSTKWKLAVKHGRDGRDGKSAFEIAVEKGGFKGSEQDWLRSLKGPPGKDGKLVP
jgi:hypothetical protein